MTPLSSGTIQSASSSSQESKTKDKAALNLHKAVIIAIEHVYGDNDSLLLYLPFVSKGFRPFKRKASSDKTIFLSQLVEKGKEWLPVANWARKKGARCDWYAYVNASTDMLPWLQSQRIALHSMVGELAAQKGDLARLKWAHGQGLALNSDVCSRAAIFGHLHIIKWARENHCPWDKDTCNFAASKGHFELLKWALKNGAPRHKEILTYAKVSNNPELIDWVEKELNLFKQG